MDKTITKSARETMDWAKKFAEQLNPGDIICLHGDLGAGKTTWVKGLAEGLGIDSAMHVTSPTFVIMHIYPARIPLYHFDCYRVKNPEELAEVGFEDFIHAGSGIACIEWPEKAGRLIPEGSLHIRLRALSESEREIQVSKK